MIYGIGNKNFNDPHHRAANPELRNLQFYYEYRHPAGALQGGRIPSESVYEEHAADYHTSEVGIDGTTNILMPVLGLSVSDYIVSSHHPVAAVQTGAPSIRITRICKNRRFTIQADRPIRSVAVYTLSGKVAGKHHSAMSPSHTVEVPEITGTGIYLLRITMIDGRTVTRTHPAFSR